MTSALSGPDDAITPLLRPGERILWRGAPDPRAYALRGAWYSIPFSLMWGGFAYVWEFIAITSGAPFTFLLWGVPFVLIGTYMIFARIPMAMYTARRTAYAVTDQRLLVLQEGLRRRTVSLDLAGLTEVAADAGRDGRGSIVFGPRLRYARTPPGWPTMGAGGVPPAFEAIPEVRRVEDLIDQAIAERRRAIARPGD